MTNLQFAIALTRPAPYSHESTCLFEIIHSYPKYPNMRRSVLRQLSLRTSTPLRSSTLHSRAPFARVSQPSLTSQLQARRWYADNTAEKSTEGGEAAKEGEVAAGEGDKTKAELEESKKQALEFKVRLGADWTSRETAWGIRTRPSALNHTEKRWTVDSRVVLWVQTSRQSPRPTSCPIASVQTKTRESPSFLPTASAQNLQRIH